MQLLKLFDKARNEIQTLVAPGLGKNGIATNLLLIFKLYKYAMYTFV